MPPIQALFQPVMNATAIETDADRFRLKAEGGGLFAKMLGMGTTSSMVVDATGMRLKKSTFAGEELTFIPRHQIASTVYVVQKPVELLILGIATLIAVIGIVLLIIYFTSRKRVIVGVLSTAGTVEVLKLKANEDDVAELKAGMAFLESLLQMAPAAVAASPVRTEEMPVAPTARRSFSPPAPPAPPPPAAAAAPVADAGTQIINCPSCGTQMSVPTNALGRKVRCVSCREVFRAGG
jgi:predicted Zn finger-like uncharacterized protein